MFYRKHINKICIRVERLRLPRMTAQTVNFYDEVQQLKGLVLKRNNQKGNTAELDCGERFINSYFPMLYQEMRIK